jgi:hypothetical protein
MGYIGNKPAQGLFDTQNIKDGGVQTADIADSAVTESKIANGAVTAAKLADGAAVPPQTGQAGKYLTTNGVTASWDEINIIDYGSVTGAVGTNVEDFGLITGAV